MPCEHMRKAGNSVRERGTGEMEAVPVFKVLRFTLETRGKSYFRIRVHHV